MGKLICLDGRGRRCRAQVTAVSTTQHSDTTAWRVSAAPHFNELLWKNLRCVLAATCKLQRHDSALFLAELCANVHVLEM